MKRGTIQAGLSTKFCILTKNKNTKLKRSPAQEIVRGFLFYMGFKYECEKYGLKIRYMKPLYTKEEFKIAEGEDKLPLECYSCGNTFLKLKRVIQRTLRNKNGYTGKFCSKKCCGASKKRKLISAKCENDKCNKEHDGSFGSGRFCRRACANSRVKSESDKLKISAGVRNSEAFKVSVLKLPKKIRKMWRDGKYNSRSEKLIKVVKWKCPVCDSIIMLNPSVARERKYCSGRCRNKVNNKFQNGSRSYAERYLEEKLSESFPSLKIEFNNREVLSGNKELDVYIPSLNFAIEWNGIYHYREVNKESLVKVKKRDFDKKKECKRGGILLYVIKDLTSSKKFIREETDKIVLVIRRLIHG